MRDTLMDDGANPPIHGRLDPRLEYDRNAEPRESQDLTLGMTALLGIFMAVVLVCAVFFGFGYSTGRTLHRAKAGGESAAAPGTNTLAPPVASQATTTLQAAPAAEQAAPVIAKPSPGTTLPEAESTATEMAPEGQGGRASSGTRAAYVAPRALPSSQATPVPGVSSAGAGVMVQIAAVMKPADADALARALRGNGYNASVRTEAQDRFFHVQVGPFASREEARAMRARLAADGYSPILKQ